MKTKNFICLAGIDGSGKTIISKGLIKEMDYKYLWARWEPFFLKPFISFLNRRTITLSDDNAKHEKRKGIKKKLLRNNIIKKTWLFAAEADYFLQLIFKVSIPAVFNKNIVCDRYIYDFYIDQLINLQFPASDLKHYAIKRILGIFPQPDKVVYIRISPKTGSARKKDGTSEAYLRERKRYYDELENIYPTIKVDGEKSKKEVFNEVRKRLIGEDNG